MKTLRVFLDEIKNIHDLTNIKMRVGVDGTPMKVQKPSGHKEAIKWHKNKVSHHQSALRQAEKDEDWREDEIKKHEDAIKHHQEQLKGK